MPCHLIQKSKMEIMVGIFSCCIDLALDSKSAANLNNFYGRIRKSGRSERARTSERSRIVMVGH